MDKLKALLKERGLEIKDDQLKTKVTEFGYDPGKLSDDNAKMVADELTKQSGAIASKQPKPTNGSKPPQTDESLKKALLHAFGEKQKELNAFEGQLMGHRQGWMNEWVNRNLSTIHNTSNDAFELLKAELMKEEANADNFLGAADDLARELFAINQ
jgi:hypothetical protein